MEELKFFKGKMKDSLLYIHSSQCFKAIKNILAVTTMTLGTLSSVFIKHLR